MKSNVSSKVKDIFLRIIIYIIGLFILAMGINISINSNLGVSPQSSLPYVISLITGIEMGILVTIIYSSYILVQIIILRKDFKWINLTQLVFSSVIGYFVEFTKLIVGGFRIPTYFGQLIMLVISIILIAIGVSIYLSANLVNMPPEGLVGALSQKVFTNKSFADVKVMMDSSIVVISVTLSLIFFGKLVGVREGTVISALFIGKVMKPVQKVIGKLSL